MTPQEAIELVEQCGLNIEGIKNIECESIIVYALEKQIPKKPKYIDGDYDLPLCPSCGLSVDEDRDMYCSICGQKLDWSDTE